MNQAWAAEQVIGGQGKETILQTLKLQLLRVCRIPWSKSRLRASMRPEMQPYSRREKTKPLASAVLDNLAVTVGGCGQLNGSR